MNWQETLRARIRANAPHLTEAQVDEELEQAVAATEAGVPFGTETSTEIDIESGADGDVVIDIESAEEKAQRQRLDDLRKKAAKIGRMW